MHQENDVIDTSILAKFSQRHGSVARSEYPEKKRLWDNPAVEDQGRCNTLDLTEKAGTYGQDKISKKIHNIYQNYTDFKHMGRKMNAKLISRRSEQLKPFIGS